MDLGRYVDEPTVAALHRLLPRLVFEPILTPMPSSSVTIDPPMAVGVDLFPAPDADYSFHLTFQPEKQIHARLIGADSKQYFWYMPFEEAAFSYSLERLDNAFIETIEAIVLHETRIIQKRGLLTHSFRCDYNTVTDWKRVYGLSCMRWFAVPKIEGNQRTYVSGALVR